MPVIIPIVEGDGDATAVPLLLRRILGEHLQEYRWQIGGPKKAFSLHVLRQKLENYLRYAQRENDAAAILILLDLDDGCPEIEAIQLSQEIRALSPRLPVAIVFAHREFETWFLASLETLGGSYGLPEGLSYEGNVEDRRGAKEWLTRQMPPGSIYKETIQQPSMASKVDLNLASQRSRSFRRLLHAVEELVASTEGNVTP
jgi:hypothetical protein